MLANSQGRRTSFASPTTPAEEPDRDCPPQKQVCFPKPRTRSDPWHHPEMRSSRAPRNASDHLQGITQEITGGENHEGYLASHIPAVRMGLVSRHCYSTRLIDYSPLLYMRLDNVDQMAETYRNDRTPCPIGHSIRPYLHLHLCFCFRLGLRLV